MNSLYEVTPLCGSVASSSSEPPSWRSVTPMWKPTSMTGLQRSIFSKWPSSAWPNDVPGACMQKSIRQVVPPNAAETVPDVKSSHVVVPPKNISRCVCGSIAPGMTYFPVASITFSAETSSDSPISETLPFSTNTSPTYSSAAVTIRPPLISTDIDSAPSSRICGLYTTFGVRWQIGWAPLVPVRLALVRVRGAQDGRLVEPAADEREADGQAVDESARDARDR